MDKLYNNAMIIVKDGLVIFLLMTVGVLQPVLSQYNLSDELRFDINGIYSYISHTKAELAQAHTLADINNHYRPSWVREYISVEVLATYNGAVVKAAGQSDTLSQEQKGLIDKSDTGTDVTVEVRYIPQNTLTHNDIKELSFTFLPRPENEAKYVDGLESLRQYLRGNAISQISSNNFDKSTLAAVKFAIDEDGQIVDVHLFETSKNDEIDELLLGAICNMPRWIPATYSNGKKVKQEFALVVGNMESCVMNLINVPRG